MRSLTAHVGRWVWQSPWERRRASEQGFGGFLGGEAANWLDRNPPSPQANWDQTWGELGHWHWTKGPTAPRRGLRLPRSAGGWRSLGVGMGAGKARTGCHQRSFPAKPS